MTGDSIIFSATLPPFSSNSPSNVPSKEPSFVPSDSPSDVLSNSPSDVPSKEPSDAPSATGTAMKTKKGKSKVFATPAQVITGDVDSETTVKLKFLFDKSFTKMEYQVTTTTGLDETGNGITYVTLHCGSAGTDGGGFATMWEIPKYTVALMWWLTDSSIDPPDNVMKLGILESKNIFLLECKGKPLNTIASLYQAIRNGSIYMNIYSEKE